jgi:hypothetical protein
MLGLTSRCTFSTRARQQHRRRSRDEQERSQALGEDLPAPSTGDTSPHSHGHASSRGRRAVGPASGSYRSRRIEAGQAPCRGQQLFITERGRSKPRHRPRRPRLPGQPPGTRIRPRATLMIIASTCKDADAGEAAARESPNIRCSSEKTGWRQKSVNLFRGGFGVVRSAS